MSEAMLTVEVAYATPEKQYLLKVTVPKGSTALEAVQCSAIWEQVPELEGEHWVLGVFSQRLKDPSTYEVKEGDRVEIYRPLLVDPKQARRERAQGKR